MAAAEKTERRRRGHPVWTVCSTAVARAMVVTVLIELASEEREIKHTLGNVVWRESAAANNRLRVQG